MQQTPDPNPQPQPQPPTVDVPIDASARPIRPEEFEEMVRRQQAAELQQILIIARAVTAELNASRTHVPRGRPVLMRGPDGQVVAVNGAVVSHVAPAQTKDGNGNPIDALGVCIVFVPGGGLPVCGTVESVSRALWGDLDAPPPRRQVPVVQPAPPPSPRMRIQEN